MAYNTAISYAGHSAVPGALSAWSHSEDQRQHNDQVMAATVLLLDTVVPEAHKSFSERDADQVQGHSSPIRQSPCLHAQTFARVGSRKRAISSNKASVNLSWLQGSGSPWNAAPLYLGGRVDKPVVRNGRHMHVTIGARKVLFGVPKCEHIVDHQV